MSGQLRIAICDDCGDQRKRLTETIRDSLTGPLQAEIYEFSSGEALLTEYVPGRFDIVFLDVYMGGMSGIETARKVRLTDRNVPIVFITVSPEFALESYQVHAAHYLIKPVQQEDIKEVWTRLFQKVNPDPLITLMVDRKPVDIRLSDVLYAEVDNKKCTLHTVSGLVVARIGIDQLQLLLPDPPFCRCHRGYIVNFEHVRSVGDDFFMKNGDFVYIRKTERASIRDKYFQSLVNKVKREDPDVF